MTIYILIGIVVILFVMTIYSFTQVKNVITCDDCGCLVLTARAIKIKSKVKWDYKYNEETLEKVYLCKKCNGNELSKDKKQEPSNVIGLAETPKDKEFIPIPGFNGYWDIDRKKDCYIFIYYKEYLDFVKLKDKETLQAQIDVLRKMHNNLNDKISGLDIIIKKKKVAKKKVSKKKVSKK